MTGGSISRATALDTGPIPWGAPLSGLSGAIDVDLTATPFTNTLPIRRLGLRSGQAETILTVYVQVPELTVTTERQRYTCLEPRRRYRFESVDSDFSREIEVDSDGLVVTYPDLLGQETAIRVRPRLDAALFAWGLRLLRECTAERARRSTMSRELTPNI